MGITKDNHNVTVDGRPVRVVGTTGLVKATWELFEGDELLASTTMVSGSEDLVGTLSTGTEVTAAITQSMVGPTRVVVSAAGETVAVFDGFVA